MATEGVKHPREEEAWFSAPYANFAMFLGHACLGLGFLAAVLITQIARDYERDEAIPFAIASFLFGLGAFVILTVLGEIGKNIAEIKKNSAKKIA